MSPARLPLPLAANEGLAFAGVRVESGLIVNDAAAHRMIAARNRHGKPNADVLRPYVDASDFQHPNERWGEVRGTAPGRWAVDFPADLTPEEASLYSRPWRLFARTGGRLRERADAMRIAIARLDTFLAAPLGCAPQGFAQFDSATLPGTGLVVVASDDDFVRTVLRSGVFAAWVAAHGGRLRVRHVASFPFPWPPRSEFGSLTRAQLELRRQVIQAEDDGLDAAVAAACRWKGDHGPG